MARHRTVAGFNSGLDAEAALKLASDARNEAEPDDRIDGERSAEIDQVQIALVRRDGRSHDKIAYRRQAPRQRLGRDALGRPARLPRSPEADGRPAAFLEALVGGGLNTFG